MPTLNLDAWFRLEPAPNERDLAAGFAAAVHDPVWFLARQWQMGEHQGENATSPVLVHYSTESAPIQSSQNDQFDPTIMPAEAIVESELDDWWTMGRRIRVGGKLSSHPLVQNNAQLLFKNPPPPYERFEGTFDGKAIWNARQRIGLDEAAFEADAPPADSPQAWDSRELLYQQNDSNAFTTAGNRLAVNRHFGGRMDWYSVDAKANANGGAELQVEADRTSIPTALQYPGAPLSRWWQIEDAEVDLGGYPPDSAHTPTALLTDLIFSHGDDWFLFPVTARAGYVTAISKLTVTDSFGRPYSSEEDKWAGLRPPKDWTLFQTYGLKTEELVLWHVAELPLESGPIERVQFGIDGHSNLLWALERVVDGREVASIEKPQPASPKLNDGKPSGDATKARNYSYIPGQGAAPHWHPYQLAVEGDRLFIQRGLADLSRQKPVPMPHPLAEALSAGTPEQRELHVISPPAIPAVGVEIERRWMLARDMKGNPVLWIQRQRKPLRTPPARVLRFDVMEQSAIAER